MSNKKSVVFTYGRLNPPHSGHVKLIKEIRAMANNSKTPVVIVSHLEGTANNPLKLKNKLDILEKLLKIKKMNNVKINHTTKNKLIGFTKNKYSNNSKMVLGKNRIIKKSFEFLPFEKVEVPRNLNTSVSATKARAAVVAGNMNTFKQLTNYNNNALTKNVFNKLTKVLVNKSPQMRSKKPTPKKVSPSKKRITSKVSPRTSRAPRTRSSKKLTPNISTLV